MTLSAAGVESLLKSEFATEAPDQPAAGSKTTTETSPAKEIPAAEESGVEDPDREENVEQAEANPETGDPKPEAGGDGESEVVAEGEGKPASEETPLPADAQAALDTWEETGGPLPEPLQKLVDKRIGKLTSAREAEKVRADKAEAELQRVAAEAEALRNDPNRPASPVITSVQEPQVVQQAETTARKMVSEIENYLDDSATEEERGRVERYMQSKQLDVPKLKRELRTMNQFLTQDVPQLKSAVAAFHAQEVANEPVAKARFPWLDAKDTPEYQKAQEVMSYMPELRSRIPAHKIAAGTFVLGTRVLEALTAAGHEGDALVAITPLLAKAFPPKGTAAKTTASKTPPPKAPVTGSAPVIVKGVKPLDTASAKFNKAPTRENATQMARAALMAA